MTPKENVTRVINDDTWETISHKNPVWLANVYVPEKGQAGAAKARSGLTEPGSGQRGLY